MYRQNRDLINVGAYQSGSDPKVDEAIAMYPQLAQFLQQHMHERVVWNESLAGLATALGSPPGDMAGNTNAQPAAADNPIH